VKLQDILLVVLIGIVGWGWYGIREMHVAASEHVSATTTISAVDDSLVDAGIEDADTLRGPDEPASGDTLRKVPPIVAGCVNVNTADLTGLDQLAGVGPVIAQRIIDYRLSHGRFTTPDDLLAVKGIGPKTLAKMRNRLCF